MTLVVKLGSSIVAGADGALRADVLDGVCAQVAELHRGGEEVVMVTSGAIARGRRLLGLSERPSAVDELQAASAVGQGSLFRAYEERLQPPFSVYIHGDFNLDNIIYDPLEKKINFIDLHRSRYMDYVQDVSVFMVSNYRLQILDAPLRRRILGVAQDFYGFARRFARKAGDDSFELRLALGLARSFATSTRFILDQTLARAMFLRARYLIELVLAANPKRPERFRIPIEEIFVG